MGTAMPANRGTLLEGPMCHCDAAKQCVFEWVDRVPCRSSHNCWFEEVPRLRPIPRPSQMWNRFRPCVDGDRKPICESGFCAFSHDGYRC